MQQNIWIITGCVIIGVLILSAVWSAGKRLVRGRRRKDEPAGSGLFCIHDEAGNVYSIRPPQTEAKPKDYPIPDFLRR